MLSACCKPQVVTETETVTVYVEKFKPFDFSGITCDRITVNEGDKWLEVVINYDQMNAQCVADIESIKRILSNQ